MLPTLKDADLQNKTVLVRVDFNVPLKDGQVTDDTRMQKALPTLRYLLERGARVVLASHLGRPSGTGFEEALSLAPVADHLNGLIDAPVFFAEDITGCQAKKRASALQPGEVLLLENLRFDKREKKNDPEFARELAALADIYVNDAFGCAHRAHASTVGVAEYLPAYPGFLLENEVKTLGGMLSDPVRPFCAVLGGSKVSDKIKVIDALLERCDTLIIGGGMCFTFLAAQGYAIGKSLCETDWIERAQQTLKAAEERGVKLLLPVDFVAADRFAEDADTCVVDIQDFPEDRMGLDIGPKSVELFAEALSQAKTVFWNGPMGVFEMEAFAAGTYGVALAAAKNAAATTIIGGGDSVAAVNKFKLADYMSFISTGGGASMELVQGELLPGVEVLRSAE